MELQVEVLEGVVNRGIRLGKIKLRFGSRFMFVSSSALCLDYLDVSFHTHLSLSKTISLI